MEEELERKSKTQIKKEAEALQRLGEELSELPDWQLERLDLPDKLRTALIDARSITSHIAGRRQRQYIGALMRNVDPEPIRMALLQMEAAPPVESEINKKVRIWLERLLTDDPAAMEELLSTCPGLERQRLRQLLRNIKKEKKSGKSSKSLNALRQIIVSSMNDE